MTAAARRRGYSPLTNPPTAYASRVSLATSDPSARDESSEGGNPMMPSRTRPWRFSSMFLARDSTSRWRHGVVTARTTSSAASMANGATGDIPPTSESMKRPVAKGTAIPATVCTIRRGEYTNATVGEDIMTDARNRVRLNGRLLLLQTVLFLSVPILASYTTSRPKSDIYCANNWCLRLM